MQKIDTCKINHEPNVIMFICVHDKLTKIKSK